MKLFAVIKAEKDNGSLMEPFVKAICSSLSAAVNAAEHVFMDSLRTDFKGLDLEVVCDNDTYKRACSADRWHALVVKVQEINCELQFAC